jgi:CMP-N,N'-diacetyllegionaminic acid synthase
MIDNNRVLAVIPARGGSKRLPRKNILDLAGKPLIAWTIEAALSSEYIDSVVVSTDNESIADISKKYGADVPFMRPDNLATDKSTSIDVILHSINQLEELGKKYDYIILLQPTSPLRTAQNIDEAIALLKTQKCDAVISVCEANHSPLWSNILPEDHSMSGFLKDEVVNKRSQDLEKFYRLNGAIYLCNIRSLKLENTFFLKKNCIAYKMEQDKSVDIDSRIDFLYALTLINQSTVELKNNNI